MKRYISAATLLALQYLTQSSTVCAQDLTPKHLIGTWRGFKVMKDGLQENDIGENAFVFGENDLIVSKPNGSSKQYHVSSKLSDSFTITSKSGGKSIHVTNSAIQDLDQTASITISFPQGLYSPIGNTNAIQRTDTVSYQLFKCNDLSSNSKCDFQKTKDQAQAPQLPNNVQYDDCAQCNSAGTCESCDCFDGGACILQDLCTKACAPKPVDHKYDCVDGNTPTARCIIDPQGPYDQGSCSDNCKKPPPKAWYCEFSGGPHCVYNEQGTQNKDHCEDICVPDVFAKCDFDNNTCVPCTKPDPDCIYVMETCQVFQKQGRCKKQELVGNFRLIQANPNYNHGEYHIQFRDSKMFIQDQTQTQEPIEIGDVFIDHINGAESQFTIENVKPNSIWAHEKIYGALSSKRGQQAQRLVEFAFSSKPISDVKDELNEGLFIGMEMLTLEQRGLISSKQFWEQRSQTPAQQESFLQ